MADPPKPNPPSRPPQNGHAPTPRPPPPDNRPPAAIQTVIPPAVRIQAPHHLYLDVPNFRCVSWSSQTPRGDAAHLQHKSTHVCWRKLQPPMIAKDLPKLLPTAPVKGNQLEGEVVSGEPSSSRARVPAPEPPTPTKHRNEKEKPDEPTELYYLRDRYLEMNVNYGQRRKEETTAPVRLAIDRYSNGHFKDIVMTGVKEDTIVRKHFHYEFYDSLGNYHAIIPMGVIHQRIYSAVSNHLERTFGPTRRLFNRYYGSFENGHQLRMVNKLWDKTQSGEAIKMAKRVWSSPPPDGPSKDDEGKGKGPPPSQV